jgi:glycosyltransferase involved in cell wall biosynthesis
MSERFAGLSTSKWLTITNGFDDARVQPLRDCPEDRCLFRYVGMLNERRTPDLLIQAFFIAAEDAEFRSTAVLEFIGDAGRHSSKAELAPGCAVRFRPQVTRAESVRFMFGSDVNVLLQTISDGQDVVSGKAFEYLHAGKPILAVVDPAGGDAWLVRETRAGVIAPWNDPGAIAAAILEQWRAWRERAGEAPPPAPNRAAFSRRALTRKLVEVFDEVLAERRMRQRAR